MIHVFLHDNMHIGLSTQNNSLKTQVPGHEPARPLKALLPEPDYLDEGRESFWYSNYSAFAYLINEHVFFNPINKILL